MMDCLTDALQGGEFTTESVFGTVSSCANVADISQLPANRRLQHEEGAEGTCDPKVVCLTHCSLHDTCELTHPSWDIGGQVRFRTMWERYCRDASAIV